MALPERQGLYDPRNEHDSCGIGFVANIKGRKSQDIIARGRPVSRIAGAVIVALWIALGALCAAWVYAAWIAS